MRSARRYQKYPVHNWRNHSEVFHFFVLSKTHLYLVAKERLQMVNTRENM